MKRWIPRVGEIVEVHDPYSGTWPLAVITLAYVHAGTTLFVYCAHPAANFGGTCMLEDLRPRDGQPMTPFRKFWRRR